MRRSFYQYVLTLQGANIDQPETKFANEVSQDIQFPKHSESYHLISDYLELNVDYLENMHVFDDIWERYLENNR